MNNTQSSILEGLPVDTVAEIANSADSLQRVAGWRPDGRVAGMLIQGRSRVLGGTEATFHSEELALAHMENLVTACVAWLASNEPVRVADASFTC